MSGKKTNLWKKFIKNELKYIYNYLISYIAAMYNAQGIDIKKQHIYRAAISLTKLT